jgi:DNA processing protein
VSGERGRVWAVRRGEAGYPAALLELGGQAPDRLFGCGDRTAVEGLELGHTVTIVGSRRASSYGLGVAEELGRLLAAAGLVVVSGMARGIDAAAHRGALIAGGTTVAVLGGGADVVYPASQRRLYQDILASGAAISEAPSGQRPEPGAFPKRNRLMAALGAITVVVEAAQPSGSLITARRASELDREVGAVPGPVTSRVSEGTNDLIADGAAPIRGAQDVLDRLLGVGVETVERCGPPLDPELARAAQAVELGNGTCDAVAVALGAGPGEAAVALARLELLGYVQVDAAGRYTRSALVAPAGEEAAR